jgi:hypothetical protein
MPGVLTHNLMPEDRADEIPPTTAVRAGGTSASVPPAVAGSTAVACSEHQWEQRPDGGRRCLRCFAQSYPQGVLFR